MYRTGATVLIADSNKTRVDLLSRTMMDHFFVRIGHVATWENLESILDAEEQQTEWGRKEVDWVFLGEGLPLSLSKVASRLVNWFHILQQKWPPIRPVCIGNRNSELIQYIAANGGRVIEMSLAYGRQTHLHLRRQLSVIVGLPVLPKLTLTPARDLLLKFQIQMLSKTRELEKGKLVLCDLCRDLFDCENRLRVGRMGQGLSGARVFRVTITNPDNTRAAFVLKLHKSSDSLRLQREKDGHRSAEITLNAGHGARLHVPRLHSTSFPPLAGDDFWKGGMEDYRTWSAIAYSHIGGKEFDLDSRFVDLEEAYVAKNSTLTRKTADTDYCRNTDLFEMLLRELLGMLERRWHSKAVRGTRSRLWSCNDSEMGKFDVFPPYVLTASQKTHILESLFLELEPYGSGMLSNWKTHKKAVADFIRGEGEAARIIAGKFRPLRCPTHGDLNCNNILVWLNERHLFLIDFPFYQDNGHAMQDFARLEIEIKFSLMDREEDSNKRELPALDWTWSQMKLWQEMEDHLQSADWAREHTFSSAGYSRNVERACRLIGIVRAQAKKIQERVKPAPRFETEYFPAFLFHTVKAIAYPSLSLFKRLLAVYSAGRMLRNSGLAR